MTTQTKTPKDLKRLSKLLGYLGLSGIKAFMSSFMIIMVMGIIYLVFGTQHYMFFHNWKGIFLVVIGVGFIGIIQNAYEKLLDEKELKNARR